MVEPNVSRSSKTQTARNKFHFSKGLLFGLGILLAVFFGASLEVASWIILHLFAPEILTPPKLSSHQDLVLQMLPTMKQEIQREIFSEQEKAYSWRYFPQLAWVNKPFQGKHINISPDGERKTFKVTRNAPPLTILCIGGSSTWGWNVSDNETWPSFLAKHLQERITTREIVVLNYGENGYETSLEVARLQHLLLRGTRPDFVIFLTGYNTSEVWLFPHFTPGYHGDIGGFQSRFSKDPPSEASLFLSLKNRARGFLAQTNTLKLKHFLHRSFFSSDVGKAAISEGFPIQLFDPHLLQSSIVDVESLNFDEVVANAARVFKAYSDFIYSMGETYKFSPLIFIQPDLYITKKELSPLERKISGIDSRPTYFFYRRKFAKKLVEKILAQDQRLQDFTHFGEEEFENRFFDTVHQTPEFNELIGKEMSKILLERIN